MKIGASLMFAQRLLFPRTLKSSTARKSVIGAIICIAISVIPLVIVVSVVNGVINGMTERIIALSSNHLQAYVRRASEHAKSVEGVLELSQVLVEHDGVKAVYPEIECNGLAASAGFRTGAQIRGMDAGIFNDNPYYKKLFKVCEGDLSEYVNGKRNAVIGEKLASILNLKAGDSFTLITTKKNKNNSFIPKVSVFKVSAIVSSGYQELDAMWVFIPLDVAFSTLPLESSLVSVQMETENPFSSSLMGIKRELNYVCAGIATVFSWDELNASKFQNFSSTRVMINFVMMLIVLVAAVNISSALVMLVMERRKEIAILKSTGGSRWGISLSFLLTGAGCGIAGLMIGIPVGLILALNANGIVKGLEKLANLFVNVRLMDPAYYLSEIPVDIPMEQIGIIAVSVVILSILVSIIPAVKAGKENPLETFRKA